MNYSVRFLTAVASPDTSVLVFSWQVKSYGQGQPSTFVGVFDINRWYHAQMPDSLRYYDFRGGSDYLFKHYCMSAVVVTVISGIRLWSRSGCVFLSFLIHERN